MEKRDWSPISLAWAAGLFEGEGCIRAATDTKSRGKYEGRLYLDVSQSEREVLDRFHRILGFGVVYGPYPKPNRQPYFRYMTSTFERSQQAIVLLWPWLSARRKAQATQAFRVATTRKGEPAK